MAILVTGGAGYIGSAAAHALIKAGHEVIVADNLSKGVRRLVPDRAVFYHIDLCDREALQTVFKKHRIETVMHFAAYKAVGESMKDAIKYSDNIRATLNLLDLMVLFKTGKIIYSSSAAVYGMPDVSTITEDSPTAPINYYGYTKLVAGELISWYSKVYGFSHISLRYFNVAGDAGLLYVDPEAENILPILMEVLTGKRKAFTINGDDYPTPDGTCVRDYIDVRDLVDAHVLALTAEYSGEINLGTSHGTSVKEFVAATKEVTGKKFKVVYGPRREGDPAILIASNKRAKEILGWEPKRDLKEMIGSAYSAYNASS